MPNARLWSLAEAINFEVHDVEDCSEGALFFIGRAVLEDPEERPDLTAQDIGKQRENGIATLVDRLGDARHGFTLIALGEPTSPPAPRRMIKQGEWATLEIVDAAKPLVVNRKTGRVVYENVVLFRDAVLAGSINYPNLEMPLDQQVHTAGAVIANENRERKRVEIVKIASWQYCHYRHNNDCDHTPALHAIAGAEFPSTDHLPEGGRLPTYQTLKNADYIGNKAAGDAMLAAWLESQRQEG